MRSIEVFVAKHTQANLESRVAEFVRNLEHALNVLFRSEHTAPGVGAVLQEAALDSIVRQGILRDPTPRNHRGIIQSILAREHNEGDPPWLTAVKERIADDVVYALHYNVASLKPKKEKEDADVKS